MATIHIEYPNESPQKLEKEVTNTNTITNGAPAAQTFIADDLLDDRYATTQRGFKSRHAQMIAIGGAIGTSLFLGTGRTLAIGGPLFLLLAFLILSVVVYSVVTAIAEVASYLPVHGGTMSYYGHRYVSRSMGFALGYLYWYSIGILIPYELTAASLLIQYWNLPVHIGVWITIMLVIIVTLNFVPVKYYGEIEFWFAGLKVVLIVGLLLLSLVLMCGGGPSHEALGFRYWQDPGPVRTYLVDGKTGQFIAFLQCVVVASFAFVFAPEQLIVTAGEMQSPRYNLPRAARRYFWRLVLLIIPTVIAIGIVCASNASGLVHNKGVAASPFVIAIKNAGIPLLDSIINVAILLSAWSAGNAFLYSSSRSLYSLAVAGSAPSILKTCNEHGVPYYAVAVSASFSLLAYLNLSTSSSFVFDWFVNLTNTAGFISWICCGIIYLRFKKAAAAQNVKSPYHSRIHPVGIYFVIVASTILLFINGFTVFFPSEWSVGNFFTAYVGIPVFLVIYFGHRIVFRKDPWMWSPQHVDMFSGLTEVLDAELPIPPRRTMAEKFKATLN